ncbi:type IV toxin-antitoxin system AbiEi family antitoxin domain-containing protein [Pseudomonas sp. REP124]|uniref:DUF6088 family protein n=1 Tax=Pseudomonas sp. REP124 TaxID=2875731 RepID=UPI001CCB32A9|nr:DUF6088 family protein [Pseudomonas sp. REP124]MBZ9782791.1 type IV toxin-antitoxin system AbiEi family antitoxin domain-containing protein [Pseudomonas sp. REP124]
MSKLPEFIIQRSQSLPEGEVLSPREFLSLGSRAAVDQAFSRLAKSGKLMRICRGMYVAPVKSRFGTRAPEPEKVVQALAEKTSETVTSSGARAANNLGLTQQVPVRQVFLTSGRARTLKIGKAEIQIKHAPKWMVAPSAAGEAVRALAWLGETQSEDSIQTLHRRLSESEWSRLMSLRAVLPSWMGAMIGREALHA